MTQEDRIEDVVIAAPFDRTFTCTEHYEGELEYLGDALGKDCVIMSFVDGWMRMYAGDGTRNED